MRGERRGSCLGRLIFSILLLAAGGYFGLLAPPNARTWISGHLPVAIRPGWANSAAPAPTPESVSTAALPIPLALPSATPTPAPERPLPDQPVIPRGNHDVARLYNGFQVRSTLEAEAGRPASIERETAASYALDLRVQIKVPSAARTAAELAHSAPTLATLLPRMPSLIEKAEVSKFFYGIYQNKTDLLRQNLAKLDSLPARDIFYDTDTILELQDPDTHRKALLIQTDMDVDTDGSDPDRLPEVDSSDPNFQPLTSYKWLKRTPTINPLAKTYQDRIDKLEADQKANPSRRGTATALETLRDDLYGIEHYSSLVALNDPYIVLPGFMVRQTGNAYQPKLGDYAVVVAGNALYPAIFGDIGPSYLLGEASLRLAQAVDPRATSARSPVDDLRITYIVFPGSAEPVAGPPDLSRIHDRCQALLNEIGGSKTELHEWASLLPVPTPPPTPAAPAPVPVAPASPMIATTPAPGSPPVSGPSAAPGASVAPTPLKPAGSSSPAATPSASLAPTPPAGH